MTRETIPKKIKESVMNEYDHRCAICGGDRPHLHHIDEDASNNVESNLLPLCPNCHLRDQHNPTRKIEIGKLQLFRKFKDPSILKAQFDPIHIRSKFIGNVEINEQKTKHLEDKANELIEFIASLEMGEFYSKKIKELIGPLRRAYSISLGGGPDPEYERQLRKACVDYRQKLLDNREKTEALLVELLRYQKW